MRALVIIPAFNECDVILRVIDKLEKDIRDLKNIDYIVVDDCSTDETYQILVKNKINFLRHTVNLGIGSGYKTGIRWGLLNGYSSFINFDADGQHDSKYLKLIMNNINENDFIVASRYMDGKRGYSPRQIGSFLLKNFIRIKTLNKLNIMDPTSGFVCLCNKEIVNFYLNSPSSYPEPSIYPKLYKNKFKVKQVSVKMHNRVDGKSYFNFVSSVSFMYEQITMIMMGY